MTQRNKKVIISVILTLSCALFIILGHLTESQNPHFLSLNMCSWNVGWEDKNSKEILSLPFSSKVGRNEELVISKTIPNPVFPENYLFIKTNYCSVTVSVEGIGQIYESPRNGFENTWTVLPIDPSLSGKEVEISITQNGSKNWIEVYSAYFGNSGDIRLGLTFKSLNNILMSIVLIVLSIFLFLMDTMAKNRDVNEKKDDFLSLSFLFLCVAIWIAVDSDLPAVFFPQSFSWVLSNIFFYILIPIPMLFFFLQYVRDRSKEVWFFILTCVSVFELQLIWVFSGTYLLDIGLSITHVLIGFLFASMLFILFVEFKKRREKKLIPLAIAILTLCLSGLMQVISFYFTCNDSNTTFIGIGLFLFLLILIFFASQMNTDSIRRTKTFSELTYMVPTGICNFRNDSALTIVYANEYFYSLFGYTTEEARIHDFKNLSFSMFPQDKQKLKTALDIAMDSGKDWAEVELRHFTKDNRSIWMLYRLKLNRLSPSGVMTAVLSNISDKKALEEKLKISYAELLLASNSSSKHLIRINLSNGECSFPPKTASLLGLENMQNDFRTVFDNPSIMDLSSNEEFSKAVILIFDGKSTEQGIVKLYTIEGLQPFNFEFSSLPGSDGKPAYCILSLAKQEGGI